MSINARFKCSQMTKKHSPKTPQNKRQIAESVGRKAEHYAALYLRLKGYKILRQRFETRHGEIDIIAQKGGILVFTEVKKRPTLSLAQDSLTPRTKSRIVKASEIFISRHRFAQKLAHRYDAVFITGRFWGKPTHYIDLWRPH